VVVGYCGPIFSRRPELRSTINGIYLGASAKEVLHNMAELLADKHRADIYRPAKNGQAKITKTTNRATSRSNASTNAPSNDRANNLANEQ
jgi:hypothetical protein